MCRGSKTERKEVSKCLSHDLFHFRNVFNTAKEKQQQNPGILFPPSLSSPSLLYPALDFPLEKECAGPGLEKPPCAQQRTLWDHPEAGAGTRPPFPASQPRGAAGTPRGLVHPLTRCTRSRDTAASQDRIPTANWEPKHLGQVALAQRKELDHHHSSGPPHLPRKGKSGMMSPLVAP